MKAGGSRSLMRNPSAAAVTAPTYHKIKSRYQSQVTFVHKAMEDILWFGGMKRIEIESLEDKSCGQTLSIKNKSSTRGKPDILTWV